MTEADLITIETMDELAQLARAQFARLDELEGSEELLSEYDAQAYQFTADGAGAVFVAITDGDVTVSVDEYDHTDFDRPATEIFASFETIRAIIGGEETIVDGVWGETVQAPVYGASMIYVSWISRILKAIRQDSV